MDISTHESADSGNIPAARTRRRSTEPEVLKFIKDEALLDRDAAATVIHRKGFEKYEERMPSERTTRDIVGEVRADAPEDSSGPWSLIKATPAEAAVVPTVIAAVVKATGGRIWHLTLAEAACIVRILSAAPDLDPYASYVAARLYVARTAAGADTADLDFFLGAAPWRENHQQPYADAVATTPALHAPFEVEASQGTPEYLLPYMAHVIEAIRKREGEDE